MAPAVIAPSITTHPANLALDQGQTANFSVTATGTQPLTYQWRRNGAILAGATGPTFSVSSVQPASAGNYTVTVTNTAGSIVSNPGVLVVNTTPVFVAQPRTQVALGGSTVVFSVEAIGGSGLGYQWRKKWCGDRGGQCRHAHHHRGDGLGQR